MLKAVSVGQLNNYIKAVFDAEELLHNIEVIGEVDGLSIRGTAVYFSLKDADACIQCVSYIPAKFREIKNGDKVTIRGRVNFWHKAGKINFTVTHIEAFGLGHLFLKLNELKEKLGKEGLLDSARKRPIPKSPKRVGIITSKQGAVLHDFINIAHRRNPALDIVLFPAQVQGAGAEKSIADAILNISKVDVIIVARGGGSSEDLSAFNSELVARTVCECPIPVVSAIGHETDWTLIDFVSDLRAPTPSAAAEICVPVLLDRKEFVLNLWRNTTSLMTAKLDKVLNTTTSCWYVIDKTTTSCVSGVIDKIDNFDARIQASNPLAVLRRGYAKILGPDKLLKPNDKIKIRVYNGEIKANIEEVNYDD